MVLLPNQWILGVLILTLALFASSVLLIVYALGRRARRDKAFKRLDELREKLRDVFDALRDETLDYAAALERAREIFPARLTPPFQQILLDRLSVPGDAGAIRRMAVDLGLAAEWQHGLGVPPKDATNHRRTRRLIHPGSFFTRASSAENLGRIRHGESWSLLAQALDDPHQDVRSAALRSLAAIGEPQSFALLVEQLRDAATQPEPKLSERDLRAALAQFSLRLSVHLLPLLGGANAKLRKLAADVLIQMLSAQTTQAGTTPPEEMQPGQEITEMTLSRLSIDEDADVRARAAALLRYLGDGRARVTLQQLLDDEAWFVRLHAVRALGERQDAEGPAPLLARLTDANWRVRESAARALGHWGRVGMDQLVGAFFDTQDAYSREQIAEELETSGELARMLARLPENTLSREHELLKEIVCMGKTACVRSVLAAMPTASQRTAILSSLVADDYRGAPKGSG